MYMYIWYVYVYMICMCIYIYYIYIWAISKTRGSRNATRLHKNNIWKTWGYRLQEKLVIYLTPERRLRFLFDSSLQDSFTYIIFTYSYVHIHEYDIPIYPPSGSINIPVGLSPTCNFRTWDPQDQRILAKNLGLWLGFFNVMVIDGHWPLVYNFTPIPFYGSW